MNEWDAWIGREMRAADRLDAGLAARFVATFDLGAPEGDTMPQGVHFCLCPPTASTAGLGQDGHPTRDDSPASFLPPFPMPRRMWASSRIEFNAPLTIDASIERISRVASVKEKEGSTGKLAFVEVEHQTLADNAPAIRETQTLVYREAAAPQAPFAPAKPGLTTFEGAGWDVHRAITPSPALLFRYSALTFNTHRIHYDAPYARDEERYRGLVVHGPLTASLLLQLAASELGENALTRFEFRGLSPAIAGEELHLVMRKADESYDLGAFASDGRQVMKASALS